MNIHELIHAWERNALPVDSEALQAAIETVEQHEADMAAWEKEAISTPVKSLYNFPLGICAHLKNDLLILSANERTGGEPA